MKKIWLLASIIVFFIYPLLYPQKTVSVSSCPTTDDPCKSLGSAFEKVSCYTNIVNICSTQRESMTAQIVYLTTRIELTNAKIQSTKEKIEKLEKEIEELTGKIERLEKSLTMTTSLFIDRVVATYKSGGFSYLNLLVGSHRFADFMNRFKYMQTVQAHDRKLLFQLQNSKINYQDQKELREEKRKELDAAKKQLEKEQNTLALQKKEKELFLEITKNSELIYSQNLIFAKREVEGIQKAASILSQVGIPKKVSRGDSIGIMGSTGRSTGPHLHFGVFNLRESDFGKFNYNLGYENPFNNLTSRNLLFDPKWSCDDMINETERKNKTVGSSSWPWPMSNPIISQCFGSTPYSRSCPTCYLNEIHNGIDMYDDVDTLIRTVDEGNAYFCKKCDSWGGNGVFIFHPNGKMTLYWHLKDWN